ncbi:DEAD-box ATP-dependent RNA helicase 47, mitochondrial-like [Arachis hypogaea]
MRKCIHALDAKVIIAFMNNTKQLKDDIFKLEARGMKAAELHGDLGKLARSSTLKKFKNDEVRVLVTNELLARDLDVVECDLVVNLDLPTDSTHYAHRAGRTGRLGKDGTVLTICEECKVFIVKKMEKHLGVTVAFCNFVEGKMLVNQEEKALSTSRK